MNLSFDKTRKQYSSTTILFVYVFIKKKTFIKSTISNNKRIEREWEASIQLKDKIIIVAIFESLNESNLKEEEERERATRVTNASEFIVLVVHLLNNPSLSRVPLITTTTTRIEAYIKTQK